MLVSKLFSVKQFELEKLTITRRNNSWKLTGLHACCAILLTVGYALREYGAFNYMFEDKESSQMTLGIYIASQVFIYICP